MSQKFSNTRPRWMSGWDNKVLKVKTLMHTWATVLCIVGLAASVSIQASSEATAGSQDTADARPGENYQPGDPLASIAAARDSASKENKLVLVVMGANWCHDSRALASRLQAEPLSNVINQHYETVFVDVGHLDKGKDVINSLGIPVYYATPTVLIIDPVSGKLINIDNRHRWGNAANISMEESVLYFEEFASTDLAALRANGSSPAELSLLLTEIETFEITQADRLYGAYAVLTPMLEAFDKGDKEKFSQTIWDEVRQYRFKLARDMDTLRSEARQKVAAGETNIHLDYPTYPLFSWE